MAAKRVTELVTGVVSTTDATVTTIVSFATTSGETGSVRVLVSGRSTTNTHRGAFQRNVGYQNVSGTLTVGTTVLTATDRGTDMIAAAVTVTNSGTNLVVQVTSGNSGVAADWFAEVRILRD